MAVRGSAKDRDAGDAKGHPEQSPASSSSRPPRLPPRIRGPGHRGALPDKGGGNGCDNVDNERGDRSADNRNVAVVDNKEEEVEEGGRTALSTCPTLCDNDRISVILRSCSSSYPHLDLSKEHGVALHTALLLPLFSSFSSYPFYSPFAAANAKY